MNRFKITLGAMALAVAAVAIVACSKEKTAQQETTNTQQPADARDYTLAEMVDALSWEEGKAFFQNQPIKDYTYVCEKVLNDCGFAEKEAGIPYEIVWRWRMPNGDCDPEVSGTCLMVRKKENDLSQANAMGYFEDGKLVIVPITEENGFTADGYLAIGISIEVQYEDIVVQDGIYVAYYDVEAGRYTAVAVDYYRTN